MPTILVRRSGETPRNYYFDFSDFPEIRDDGETLSSVVSVTATPSGLTVGSGTISGNRVRSAISSGTAGVTYTLACIVVTSGGSRLEVFGQLAIKDPP